jgi:4-amino-4-deoxy-L-arabinose transferase-like glycosyltransferase
MQTIHAPAPQADLTHPAIATPQAARPGALRIAISAHRLELATALVILIAGFALRLLPLFGVPDRLTLDEHLYITNVQMLKSVGPFEYSALVQEYVAAQSKIEMVMLPPTRCVYIMLGWAWDAIFHCGPRMALRCVASVFSCLSLVLAGVFAYRLGGTRIALVTLALMAVAPLELMMAHRELVDGVFAFWAMLCLWLLWENMQNPGRLGWMAVYAGAISVMVLTKENAFFAAVALGGIQCVAAAFPGLDLGKAKWSTMIATFIGGLMGLLVLISITGSPRALIATYELLVSKAEKMTFAYETGSGPWYRYAVDLMLISPAILLPAIGGIFALRRDDKRALFLLLFILFSCAVMVNVKNGMNVRYATMWDLPLRFLAAGALLRVADGVKRWPLAVTALLVAAIGGIELHQYFLIFVQHDIGEPVTQALMYATGIVRVAGQ